MIFFMLLEKYSVRNDEKKNQTNGFAVYGSNDGDGCWWWWQQWRFIIESLTRCVNNMFYAWNDDPVKSITDDDGISAYMLEKVFKIKLWHGLIFIEYDLNLWLLTQPMIWWVIFSLCLLSHFEKLIINVRCSLHSLHCSRMFPIDCDKVMPMNSMENEGKIEWKVDKRAIVMLQPENSMFVEYVCCQANKNIIMKHRLKCTKALRTPSQFHISFWLCACVCVFVQSIVLKCCFFWLLSFYETAALRYRN